MGGSDMATRMGAIFDGWTSDAGRGDTPKFDPGKLHTGTGIKDWWFQGGFLFRPRDGVAILAADERLWWDQINDYEFREGDQWTPDQIAAMKAGALHPKPPFFADADQITDWEALKPGPAQYLPMPVAQKPATFSLDDDEKPAFRMIDPTTGHTMAVYAIGRTEGFPATHTVMINAIPLMIQRAAASTGETSEELSVRDEAFSRASVDRSTISSLRAQVAELTAENDEHRDGKIPEAWRLDARRIERERDEAREERDSVVRLCAAAGLLDEERLREIAALRVELAKRPPAFVDPDAKPEEPGFLRVLREGNKAPGGLIR